MSGLLLPDDAAGAGPDPALAVTQTTTYRWPLAEDLVGYARSGIGGIGLYRPKLEEVEEDVAIDLVRSSGLAVSSLSWIGGFTAGDSSAMAEAMFDAEEAFRVAAAVGAGTVVVAGGTSGVYTPGHARRLFTGAVRELCDRAGQLDLRLALHPFSGGPGRDRAVLADLEQLLGVLRAADCPNLGIVFDTVEFGREPDLLERIPALVPVVHLVRVADRKRRPGERRATAATLVKAFIDAGYQGTFEFDVWSDSVAPPCDYDGLLAACRTRFDAFKSARGLTL